MDDINDVAQMHSQFCKDLLKIWMEWTSSRFFLIICVIYLKQKYAICCFMTTPYKLWNIKHVLETSDMKMLGLDEIPITFGLIIVLLP